MAARQLAAVRLEASDDILLKIFSSLTLKEKLQLESTSKRWRRLLLSELRVPRAAAGSVRALCSRAASSLVSLDMSRAGEDCETNLQRLVDVLSGEAGRNLRGLVMYHVCNDRVGHEPSLSLEQALQLAAACPRLEADKTRLRLSVVGAANAAAALAALPGLHSLVVTPPSEADFASRAHDDDWDPVLTSNRLFAFTIAGPFSHECPQLNPWFDAAFDGLLPLLQSGRCPNLEFLIIDDGAAAAPTQLPDAALGMLLGAAEARRQRGGAPLCRLRGFQAPMRGRHPAFTAAVIAAAAGQLRALDLRCGTSLAGAAPLASIFTAVGDSLREFGVQRSDMNHASLSPLGDQLAAPGCKLRELFVTENEAFDDAAALEQQALAPPGELTPYERFLRALSGNASLRELTLAGCGGRAETAMLAAALSVRAAPLEKLDIISQDTARGSGVVAGLASAPCVLCLSLVDFPLVGRDVQALAAVLADNTTLRVLRFCVDPVGAPEPIKVADLFHALARNTILQELQWDGCPPDGVNWRDAFPYKLPREAFPFVAALLEKNSTLRVLNAPGLGLGTFFTSDLVEVSRVLGGNRGVEYLCVSDLNSCQHVALLSSEALQANTTLRTLVLFDGIALEEYAADMGAAIARILRPGISRLRTIAFKDYYDDINVPVNLSDSAIFTLAATALRAHPRLKIVVEEAPSYQQPGNVMLPPRLRLLALPDDLRGRIVTRMGDCSDLNSLRELLGPPSFLPGGSDEEKPRA